MAKPSSQMPQTADTEWITFPGGELEGKRPSALCPACRARLPRAVGQAVRPVQSGLKRRPLCFQCYRAGLERDKALKAAGQLDTASDARFQSMLPFDPVNTARLAALKAARTAERAAGAGPGRYASRRRQAQIAARHALQAMGAGVAAIHAAELQLPESWLPFVVLG
jgi:hypothetical protein